MNPGRLLAPALAAALLLPAGGCLFDVGKPVPPTGGGTCLPALQSGPDSVLANLRAAFNCDDRGNPVLFADALDDGFRLVLDPLDAAELGGRDSLAAEVVRRSEETLFTAAGADSAHLALTVPAPDRTDVRAVYFAMPYTLEFFNHPENGAARSVGVWAGEADVTVHEKDNSLWAITLWVDHRAPGHPALGRLLADHASAAPGSPPAAP